MVELHSLHKQRTVGIPLMKLWKMAKGLAEAAPAVLESQGRQEPSELATVPVLVVGVAVENPSSPVVIRWLLS